MSTIVVILYTGDNVMFNFKVKKEDNKFVVSAKVTGACSVDIDEEGILKRARDQALTAALLQAVNDFLPDPRTVSHRYMHYTNRTWRDCQDALVSILKEQIE